MMLRSKSFSGFSLVEVIVVMAIMTTLLALSGGLLTKSVDKQERLVELEKVHQLFKRLSYEAYYKGTEMKVSTRNNVIEISSSLEQRRLEFSQLTFVANDYTVSTKAVITPQKFSVFWNDDIRHFPIAPLYKSYVDE